MMNWYTVGTIYVLLGVLLMGVVLLFLSFVIVRKIILSLSKKGRPTLFWEIIGAFVVLFFSSYLTVAYFIYMENLSILPIISTFTYLVGAFFVFIILLNSYRSINYLIQAYQQIQQEFDIGEINNKKLKEQSEALAVANARMTHLYIDLEEIKNNLEQKRVELIKQNEQFSKVNIALAEANSKMTNLYIELEDAKDKLQNKEVLLRKKNQLLSKSNIVLADVFKRFVPEQFLDRIANKGIENIRHGYAERVNLSILFADLRGFSSIAERLDPEDLLKVLNKYFSAISEQIYKNGGFIDKFIGDAVLSLYEKSTRLHISHATAALNAAIDVQNALRNINQEISGLIGYPLKVGIGIHSGDVVIGTVGLEKRMDSTVLGNAVNIASRIENLTKEFDAKIILSEDTLKQIDKLNLYHYRTLGIATIRGVKSLINLYEFLDADDEDIRLIKQKTIPYFEKGIKYMSDGIWEAAEKEFQASLAVYPQDTAAKYLLDQCKKNILPK